MRLISVRVENFKCVEDSTTFSIDDVTCLVGKNEAGKTALLEALHKLNPASQDEANFNEEEYPRRHLTTYRERQEKEPSPALTTTWELTTTELKAIANEFGDDALTSQEIVISRGYDNVQRWRIPLNEEAIVSHFIEEVRFNAAERSQVGTPTTVSSAIRNLSARDGLSRKQQSLLATLQERFPKEKAGPVLRERLSTFLPVFVYFSNYHALPGRVALTKLRSQSIEGKFKFEDRIFLALLAHTSTCLDDIEELTHLEQLIRELEAVEATLTDEIKEFWSQNRHLEVRFRFDMARPDDPPPFNEGYIFSTRIFNTRHRATVNFAERSHGFVWFFSFLIWFSQVRREYGEKVIILLDEPGLPLHGRAQEDLLRYINERLRPKYQVIYTAHSPFMIDVENIFSLRTVEDVVEESEDGEDVVLGTKVGERILSRDEDTLFPLQGILGFNVAQTLFVGPNVLVVEGPTEKAVVDWFSKQLVRRGRDGLDLRWAVCPAEGADKISSFVTLFSGRNLKIAVLMDYHTGQKKKVRQLEESRLLEEDHVLRTDTYTKEDESDIEDLFGRQLYRYLVNHCMGLTGDYVLPEEAEERSPSRIVKEVEAHCALLPPGFSEFYHYKPIEFLLGLSDEDVEGLPGLNDALETFEALFRDLNLLIE